MEKQSIIARKIKELRIKAGLKQLDVAQLLKCDPSHINRLEKSKGRPSLQFAELFEKMVKAPAGTLTKLVQESKEPRKTKSVPKTQSPQVVKIDFPLPENRFFTITFSKDLKADEFKSLLDILHICGKQNHLL